jgi:hypothetical protein
MCTPQGELVYASDPLYRVPVTNWSL